VAYLRQHWQAEAAGFKQQLQQQGAALRQLQQQQQEQQPQQDLQQDIQQQLESTRADIACVQQQLVLAHAEVCSPSIDC